MSEPCDEPKRACYDDKCGVRATEAQAAFLALVATHGGVAVLARSLDDLTPFLEMPA